MSPKPNRLQVDEARLLPHLRQRSYLEERFRLERAQASVLEREHQQAISEGRSATMPSRLHADPQDLRGIPVVGRGVGGVSPGTQPEAAATR